MPIIPSILWLIQLRGCGYRMGCSGQPYTRPTAVYLDWNTAASLTSSVLIIYDSMVWEYWRYAMHFVIPGRPGIPGARESREWRLCIPDSREWKNRSGNANPIGEWWCHPLDDAVQLLEWHSRLHQLVEASGAHPIGGPHGLEGSSSVLLCAGSSLLLCECAGSLEVVDLPFNR